MRSWVSALVVVAACSSADRPTTTAKRRVSPAACKAVTAQCDPEIADEAVFELVRHRCWACHATDGIANHDFPDLSALRAAPVADMVGTCQMPPDGAPLPDADRQLLVAWATCAK